MTDRIIQGDCREVLSYGAGVNSTALAILLINEGWHGPLVFADTGAEWPETYEYMDYFEGGWLMPRGFEVVRLHPHSSDLFTSKAKGRTLIEYCLESRVIPMGLRRWCTERWKIEPINRYAKQCNLSPMLIGIDAGESHRASKKRNPPRKRPLVDRGIDRESCKAIISAEGLQIPPKSGCFICPFQRSGQWRRLWQLHPDLFDLAMRLEENAPRFKIPVYAGQKHAMIDVSGRTTLRQRKMSYELQMELW